MSSNFSVNIIQVIVCLICPKPLVDLKKVDLNTSSKLFAYFSSNGFYILIWKHGCHLHMHLLYCVFKVTSEPWMLPSENFKIRMPCGCFNKPFKALHSELLSKLLSRFPSRNEFSKISEVRIGRHFFEVFGKIGKEF